MLENNYEILVIDDIVSAANDCAELIQTKLKFKTLAVSTSKDAIEAIRKYNIRVVVIDQVMPGMTGTQLYKVIKPLNPLIRTIMLTGEATGQDVGDALRIGFNDYLSKNDILELSNRVLSQYIKYDIDISNQIALEKPILLNADWRNLYMKEYYLINISSIKGDLTLEDNKEVIFDLFAGQTFEYVENYTFTDKLTITEQVEVSLKQDLSIRNLNTLKCNINSAINSRFGNSKESTYTSMKGQKQTYKLPDQPTDNNIVYLNRRVIERFPVFKEYVIIIGVKCKLCKSMRYCTTRVHKHTHKFKCIQTDYMSDQSTKTLDLGIHKLSKIHMKE